MNTKNATHWVHRFIAESAEAGPRPFDAYLDAAERELEASMPMRLLRADGALCADAERWVSNALYAQAYGLQASERCRAHPTWPLAAREAQRQFLENAISCIEIAYSVEKAHREGHELALAYAVTERPGRAALLN